MENPLTQQSGPRLSIVALLLFIVAFAAAWFYIKPQWEEVSAMEVQRNTLIEERRSTNQKLVELQKLQQELNLATEVSKETTLAAIPETLDQDELIRELSDIAEQNDLIMNNVSFSIPQSAVGVEIARAQLNVNLNGSQGSLISFLRDVESSARKMIVKNIAVQLGESAVGARINFNLSIEVYYQGSI